MFDDDTSKQETNQGLGLGTLFVIIGAFIIGALVTANKLDV